jgi:hypothetical protein
MKKNLFISLLTGCVFISSISVINNQEQDCPKDCNNKTIYELPVLPFEFLTILNY